VIKFLSLYDRDLPITALPDQFPEVSLTEEPHKAFDSQNHVSAASASGPPSPRPPPFSSLYFPPISELQRIKSVVTEAACESFLATAPAPSFEETLAEDEAESRAAAETKAVLPRDTKGEASGKGIDDGEPPPPYTEGSSPLESFTYVMAAAGGAASIITQVQQTAGPPINALGGWSTLSVSVSKVH
jgi:dipeptidyl-peptidase III